MRPTQNHGSRPLATEPTRATSRATAEALSLQAFAQLRRICEAKTRLVSLNCTSGQSTHAEIET